MKIIILLSLLLSSCSVINPFLESLPSPPDMVDMDAGQVDDGFYYIKYSTNTNIDEVIGLYRTYLINESWVDMGKEEDGTDIVLAFYKEELNHIEVVTIRIAPEQDGYVVVVMYSPEGVQLSASY